jgi:outer membrane murein-binding lipoprotein Lpp
MRNRAIRPLFLGAAIPLLLLAFGACHGKLRSTKPRPAVAARPLDYFAQGEELLGRGSYTEAIAAYETHLRENPEATNRDLALMRLATAYAAPGSQERDLARSTATLRRLLVLFPNSPWRPHAEYLIELQSRIDQLTSEVTTRNDELARMTEELTRIRNTPAAESLPAPPDKARAELRERDEKIRRLSTEVEALEERVKRLTAELDALKKIDLQRRPARPPR